MEKDRLNLLRRQAIELAFENRKMKPKFAVDNIRKHRLKIHPGHFERMNEIAITQEVPYFLATRELRKQIMHDELDCGIL